MPTARKSPPCPLRRTAQPRAGLTLIELLVVLIIVAILTAVTIPVIKPAMDTRKVREATRLVSTMLGAAQTRAVTTGRPAGVWFERFTDTRPPAPNGPGAG